MSNPAPISPPLLAPRKLELDPVPPPQQDSVFIPVLESEPRSEGPPRSSCLSDKSGGMHISVLEKALKKKEKEDMIKRSKKAKKAGTSSSRSKTGPPPLVVEKLSQVGYGCGFNDKEEGELIEAAAHNDDE
jgi:hypothetical protein